MNNVAEKLYNILGTKFDNTDIKTLDSSGKETTDMEEIEMFSFDFVVGSHNYGPVVILLSAEDNLEVYYGDNTSKVQDTDAKKKWENVIEHLSTFARTNRLGFSLKHTTDLKYDLSNLTDITESYKNIFEGYYGTKKTSYSPQGKAKIIIKHSKAIGEDDKRFRNISSLFIENADGERFKLPFKKLAGARAMARHVTEGGNPYDLFGLHITEMVKDINTLGGFVRRSKMYEGNDDAMGLVETGRTHYDNLRKGLKRIAGVRGYHTYKESWEPSEITEVDEATDSIRKLFTEKKVDQRTEDAIPLLAKLQQMAEATKTVQTPSGPKEVEVGDEPEDDSGKQINYSDQDIDLDESDSGKPTEVEIYKKIKDWSLVALKGYARRIKMPREIVDQRGADEDTMIDEIMGFLFDDDWEIKLIKAGAFNEDPAEVDETTGNDMKEITEFEQWADTIVEGTWAIPDTPKAINALKKFMATEQPVGIDAINATDALDDIIGDDDLFDALDELAADDPDGDARIVVKDFIETMYRNRNGYEDKDQVTITRMYKAVADAGALGEGYGEELDADDDTQLNASINKDMDKHVRQGVSEDDEEDADRDIFGLDDDDDDYNDTDVDPMSNPANWEPGEEYGEVIPPEPKPGTQEFRDKVLQQYADAKKFDTKESVTESEEPLDLNTLMERTNFLLRK